MADTTSAIQPPRPSRRQLLRQAGLVGLGLVGTPALLAACGQAPMTATATAPELKVGVATPPVTLPPATASPAARGQVTPVRMACWSQPIAEQANVYAAEEFGWFKDQGIAFTFVPGAGGGDALKNLLAGNADFAFTNVEPLLFAIQEGAKLKAVYNIYPQNVFNVISLKAANITKIADLKGKKVGIFSQASGTRYNLLVMLRSAGLRERDVEEIAAGAQIVGPLKEGKVDAYAATDTTLYTAEQSGLGEVNVLWARDVLNTPSDVFVVSEETYQRRKELIARFLKAYKQGSQWMLDNPDKAAQLAVKYATDGKDVARNRAIVDLRNTSTVSAATATHGLGYFDLDVLKQAEATYSELGITKQRFDVTTIFTNEFIAGL